MNLINWKAENDVDDWVKDEFKRLNLEKHKDWNEKSTMSNYMKSSLIGASKTKSKKGIGVPDFNSEKYHIPIVIEDKLHLKKLILETKKDGIKFDEKSIESFAVNGALYYAQAMIKSGKYEEVIAIGIAGDSEKNVTINVYYVFGTGYNSYKYLHNIKTLDFLETQETFDDFYQNAILNENDKHELLINSRNDLQSYAQKLNKLMHNHNITAPQRVLYVSGMLLSMQDIIEEDGTILSKGLTPDDLKGSIIDGERDGKKIINYIDNFLNYRNIPKQKKDLMLASFNEIAKDNQRDEKVELDSSVSKLLKENASINKQIFTFIYEYIFKQIDGLGKYIDIMGEMYSEFLKYALGDGKEIGIVLTPPYVTKMMAEILNINSNNHVMDLATGSAGFLIASMEIMIEDANKKYGKNTSKANEIIKSIKEHQLLGIELNAEMFTLASTNMILRGDGSSHIEKGSAFNRPESLFTDFNADRLLLNPPFSYEENGLPFIAYGLDKMKQGGLGAIIIQDSAGSGKAVNTAKSILSKHTLLASIKMPIDLFDPMASVQTSIYIFEAHKPHDFDHTVKFIDFSNDGYKRTKRSLTEIDSPAQRYQDIVKIYKAGDKAKVDEKLWNLKECYVEDFIDDSGKDWNFNQHQVIDITPTLDDFKKTVSDYLTWEVSQILQNQSQGEDEELGK